MSKYDPALLEKAVRLVRQADSYSHGIEAIFDSLERAPWWEEVGEGYEVDFNEPIREEYLGSAWEYLNAAPHRSIGSLLKRGSTVRYFRDTRWTPPPAPLAVGDVIETVEDLERLPFEAVLIDCDSDAWQKAGLNQFLCVTSDGFYTAIEAALKSGPFAIVHLPKTEATE